MKQLCAAVLVLGASLTAQAQGTVWFLNVDQVHGLDAPFYESDGVTKLAGPDFMAELLAGANPGNLASLGTTGFLAGGVAGYFNGGFRVVPDVPAGGTAWIQLRAWNVNSGPTFASAQASGLPNSWAASSIFSVVAGTPSQPAVLTPLGTTPILLSTVPEPSVLALAGAAAVMGVLLRRKG